MRVVLSIDQSTQGTKGLVWSLDGELLARADLNHRQIVSREGWVSHDLNEIWENVKKVATLALERAGSVPGDVCVIGISNQRETACCWDRQTGAPLSHAVVWQCGRAQKIAERLRRDGWEQKTRLKTGLMLSPYFSAPKYRWLLENAPEVRCSAEKGRLCFGTVDSYLLFRMTQGAAFATDYSNASRTGLLNLDTLAWDEELLSAYGLKREWLAQVRMSDALFGETTLDGLLPEPIPIHGVLGDSHAALFAHRCVEAYTAKVTYGTGSSIMMNAGTRRPEPGEGIVASLAWGCGGTVVYCLEGNINYTGAVITWLVQDMKLLTTPSQAGPISATLSDNDGVYLVPAFSGLGAPYFDSNARAAIVGMSRGATPAHIVRAAEECIAYQIRDVVCAMEKAAGRNLAMLCADGGPTRDAFLMQFQSDILGMPLHVSSTAELSGAGAAYCAALAGQFTDERRLFGNRCHHTIRPKMSKEVCRKNLKGWHSAVRAASIAEEIH